MQREAAVPVCAQTILTAVTSNPFCAKGHHIRQVEQEPPLSYGESLRIVCGDFSSVCFLFCCCDEPGSLTPCPCLGLPAPGAAIVGPVSGRTRAPSRPGTAQARGSGAAVSEAFAHTQRAAGDQGCRVLLQHEEEKRKPFGSIKRRSLPCARARARGRGGGGGGRGTSENERSRSKEGCARDDRGSHA